MRAPAKAADDMAEALDGLERGIENGAAAGIVDEVKTFATGVSRHIVLQRFRRIVDGRCPHRTNEIGLADAVRGKHPRSERCADLHGHVADTPASSLHE
ncbi:hypothetical protein D9M72_587440 [compost metagenome]